MIILSYGNDYMWLLVTNAKSPGPRFNIKMISYQYRKSHCGDKMILRPSYLHNGISYTGKTTSLYWIISPGFDKHYYIYIFAQIFQTFLTYQLYHSSSALCFLHLSYNVYKLVFNTGGQFHKSTMQIYQTGSKIVWKSMKGETLHIYSPLLNRYATSSSA